MGRFFIKLAPKDAVLRVDGAPPTYEEDGSVLLSFGRHPLTAEAPGRSAENREVNVVGGERQDLALELPSIPVAAVPRLPQPGGIPSAGVLATPRRDDGSDETRQGMRAAWWFAGAGVMAGGAVAGVFWWRFQHDQVDVCDRAGICHNRDGLVARERLALGAAIGGAAGALALGTIGTVVWAKNRKTESDVALACVPGYGAVNCEIKLTF